MNDVMLDTETLDTVAGGVVLSVAMVRFDRNTGQVGDHPFYRTIDITSSMKKGMTVGAETLKWWLTQKPEALKAALDQAVSIPEFIVALRHFTHTAINQNTKVWAQGTDFDIPMMKALYEAGDSREPWKFYNVRDTRTAYDLCNFDYHKFPREGTFHNALDDCHHQIKALMAAFEGS